MADSFLGLLTGANNSGVEGLALVTLNGVTLHVDMAGSGLTPSQVHQAHIHGLTTGAGTGSGPATGGGGTGTGPGTGAESGAGTERLAVIGDDTNADGLVQTAEAVAVAGQPLLDLTTSGTNDHGAGTATDFPSADANGHVQLTQNYQLDPAQANDAALLSRLDGRIMELHGLNLPGTSQTPGAAATTYDPTLPVAQAELFGVQSTTGGTSGTGTTTGTGTTGTGTTGTGTTGTDTTGTGTTGTTPGFDWLHADSASFLQHANAVLNALAPYTLKPDGSGPLAPQPTTPAGTHPTDFVALLTPENNSGALGAAAVHVDPTNTTITVDLWAHGLTPDQMHAAHIHGLPNGQPSLLPNLSLDTDHDHFVEDQEGERVTGPAILSLTSDGSITSDPHAPNFASADANGDLHLQQSYHFNAADPTQQAIFNDLSNQLTGREVQIHGLTTATQGAGTQGEVDGTAGYKADLPVADGILLPLTDPAAQDIASLASLLQAQFASQAVTDHPLA